MPDDPNCRCKCPRCTIRSLRGPAVLITVGILFLLDQMRGSYYLSFHNTWPVILLVLGAISLASALAPMDGHIETRVNAVPPAVPPVPPTAPPVGPQGPFPGQGR
jgi:hypothetical protein